MPPFTTWKNSWSMYFGKRSARSAAHAVDPSEGFNTHAFPPAIAAAYERHKKHEKTTMKGIRTKGASRRYKGKLKGVMSNTTPFGSIRVAGDMANHM